jgi:hypothetical protein
MVITHTYESPWAFAAIHTKALEHLRPYIPNVHWIRPTVHWIRPNVHWIRPNVHWIMPNVHWISDYTHIRKPLSICGHTYLYFCFFEKLSVLETVIDFLCRWWVLRWDGPIRNIISYFRCGV